MIFNYVEEKNPKDRLGKTPLHIAVEMGNEDIYDIIMARIKELNQNDFEGILHLAAQKGLTSMVKMIIQTASDKNPRDDFGCTLLHYAAQRGKYDICKLILMEVEDKNPENDSGKTPLDLAYMNENYDIFKANPKDKNGKTPLHHAAENDNLKLCQMILEDTCDIFRWISFSFCQ